MIAAVSQKLHSRSVAILGTLEARLPRIMTLWFVAALMASALRIAFSPIQASIDTGTILPYMLLVTAPLVSMAFALIWFREGDRMPQPKARLAVIGRWRSIDRDEAIRQPLYGTSGIMVSLLVGMLLNVPVRALEYMAAVPAISGPMPSWVTRFNLMMTLDVVLLSSLYTIAFVAALRRVPLFPRLLVGIWIVDLAMQLAIAAAVSGTEGLPPRVAGALQMLLEGNVKKVLISVALWMPYLLLSKRVNVTFRHRVEA
jgi:hypothetical protein